MNKRIWIYSLLILGAAVLIGLAFGFFSSLQPLKKENKSLVVSSAAVATTTPKSKNQSPADQAIVRNSLKEIIDRLKKIGGGEEPPTEQFLKDAVASGDKGKILRAFNDVIYHRKMREVIPVLKSFLNDPNPYVRYLAGQNLLIVGDNSGAAALLALVQSNDPIEGIGNDVRISAATALAQFGQTDAAEAIYNLYQQSKSGDLIAALARLGSPQAAALTEARGYFSDASSLAFYGQAGATQFIPQITSTFYNTQNSDVKAAAAWALATMTGDQNATNYLVQTAQADLNNPNQTGSASEREAILYLGTIQTSAAKQTLEAALSSSDSTIVQTAIVNLIYNQGGSDKAVQVIANQLNNSTQATLPWDFTLNVATQLLSNPAIQSAGQMFSQHDATGDWQTYTVERQNWPVSNWVGNYVVKLNK